ncbi:MAG: hypothetical protein A3G81_05285 [Betaproteobacteria bacterium RIFCSPLOWO2_12_FULL_65_14]|nr:MAG: hypothetical protein A3G81_05285 [Betaproteobacteria bacterium RIFCSPLOWO2_12_FULL_65_14]
MGPREKPQVTPAVGEIRLRRHELKLTQAEVAERAGVTQVMVSFIEGGQYLGSPTARSILRVLLEAEGR